ncbi:MULTISPECIES: trimethylamine methyltransferase family protein [unclassified Mesorhizobium]|uniref:trimethylamine methyltransferase family protein n=1 Tax=unclassified Mesorhizobium TaxID=325217 RepID=UPI000FD8596D|nr:MULTISPECIES: trimethylamine methyltransferase family protein [unclassified Mesorhizobium]TGQ08605.1 trimethylamine methyltransferase [Mesorhizobium sp. M2E.F.Ca.ET.219.01.1.1]TGT69140.1 trimethylamine methyltransferase [Mesorhizobium sp. M2E.F.Ca.ET.166.01.1.1]TGW01473.1 trimethylamine methyltransferase [Mesorhizobium sp. M2E.F.Ca.ET.154.01.1.1]
MNAPAAELTEQTHRRGGGRLGRKALRSAPIASFPTLVRKIPAYEIVPEEAVELIHEESLKILEEVGCEFRDDGAIELWKAAGADVRQTRVRIDRALLMELVSKVPAEFTLHARNPERTVRVGGKNSIFVPMYGAPYVRDLDNKRRYGTLADLNNFHKMAYMAPALHSSSSVICEPMEIPVPKRHLHIIHSALKHSDKPFMGIVTSKERAEDTMAMAGIVFGEEFVRDNPVLVAITNCNSPLVWDTTMIDAMRVYASHNQPLILAPFALCGASTSASAVGAVAQVNAEALAGVALTQLIRPGSPQLYGQFMVTVDMKTGAPMGGTPEAAQMMYLMGALARKYKLPWRTSGFHVGSKLNDAQAGYEANMLMHAAILSGANYIWHSAGWLEAGLTCGYSKFATDCEQLIGWYKYAGGVSFDDFKDAMAAIREVGPQGHFLGTQHTLEHFESAFFMPNIMDFNSFEQWSAEGAKDHDTRGREKARAMLADYQEPRLDEGIAEGLADLIARREEKLPDSVS